MATPTDDYWSGVAGHWRHQGSPQIPGAEDLEAYRRGARDAPAQGKPILMLGVTPQLAEAAWPEGSLLLALDHNRHMIDRVWPGDTGKRKVLAGDWRHMPLANDACALVIGDGWATILTRPDRARVIGEISRVLAKTGRLITRAFLRPSLPPTVEALHALVSSGQPFSGRALRWQVAHAMQHAAGGLAIPMHDIWVEFSRIFGPPAELAARYPAEARALAQIDAYKGIRTCLDFLLWEEFLEAIGPHFQVDAMVSGGYPLGSLCPVVTLRPR